jgi:hypothetical protein
MAGENSERLRLAFLICLHIVLSCVSLVYVSEIRTGFHILYDPSRLYGAIAVAIAFAVVAWLFTFVDFSFGYFVGFYLYTMVLGYLWINCFSDFDYNHRLFGLSAAASGAIIRRDGKYLQPRLFQRVTVGDRRHRFGGTIVRADFSVCLRARIRTRQPPVCRSATTLYPDLRRHPRASFPQCAVDDGVAHAWRGRHVSALVCNPTRNVRR